MKNENNWRLKWFFFIDDGTDILQLKKNQSFTIYQVNKYETALYIPIAKSITCVNFQTVSSVIFYVFDMCQQYPIHKTTNFIQKIKKKSR